MDLNVAICSGESVKEFIKRSSVTSDDSIRTHKSKPLLYSSVFIADDEMKVLLKLEDIFSSVSLIRNLALKNSKLMLASPIIQSFTSEFVKTSEYSWLKSISISKGDIITPPLLSGPPYRSYCLSCELLSHGTVLPFKLNISRRFSDLHEILKVKLQLLIDREGLNEYFFVKGSPYFPEKSWQSYPTRLSDKYAQLRADKMGVYLNEMISKTMQAIHFFESKLDQNLSDSGVAENEFERSLRRNAELQNKIKNLGSSSANFAIETPKLQEMVSNRFETTRSPRDFLLSLSQVLKLLVLETLNISEETHVKIQEFCSNIGDILALVSSNEARIESKVDSILFSPDPQQGL